MMTFNLQTVLALLTALSALVGIYVNLNEKVARSDERYHSLAKQMDEANDTIEKMGAKMESHQKEVTTAVYQMSSSIEKLNFTLQQISKKIDL
jgi:predicted  nucleic acid-binding Zn-ribbon protein